MEKSVSNAGTPAGWYPDPENPGQSRYWDGTAWAAPVDPTVLATASSGGDSGGNKTALIVVAIVAVVALIGGGAYFWFGGDDDKDDDEKVATDDDRDDADDGGDRSSGPSASSSEVEELSESDFVEWANGLCHDFEDELEDISELYFGGIPSDELDNLPRSVLSAFESDMLKTVDRIFPEMRTAGPEGDIADWLDLVDDWEDVYLDVIDEIASGDFDAPERHSAEIDDIRDRSSDFGLACLSGSSIGGSPDSGPSGQTGGSSSVGDPTPPPSFDDPEFAGLAQDCYEGNFEACDDLYLSSPFGSAEEEYGDTCGGRTDGGSLCVFLDD